MSGCACEVRPCTCMYGLYAEVNPNCVYHGSNWVRVSVLKQGEQP